MTTGEGGMITTHSPEIAEKARTIRNHGGKSKYVHEQLGFNMRMMDLQAAIGLIQLEKLDAWNEQRRSNAEHLKRGLEDIQELTTPSIRPGGMHVFNQFTIRTRYRDDVITKLREKEIGTAVHYPRTIPEQPYYQDLGYESLYPQAEAASREVLSLPVHPGLKQEDLDRIVKVIHSIDF
jgi:dTDP-4-amino-4,6-dideoxygalactose transaminase